MPQNISDVIYFYSNSVSQTEGVLTENEAKHCQKVLRIREGDRIHVLDGIGHEYLAEVSELRKSEVHFKVLEVEFHQAPQHLPSLGISLLKNQSRLEWMIEKATEIGVREIYPMVCERTIKRTTKIERLSKICLSAMKQSHRRWLPQVHPTCGLSEILDVDLAQNKWLCTYNANNLHLYDSLIPQKRSIILVGPEGDFASNEIGNAINAGWCPVNIAHSRLRTETAGITACQIVNIANR